LDAAIMEAAYKAEVWSYDDNDYIDEQIRRKLWHKPREEHPDFEPEPYVTWRYRRGGPPGTDPAAIYGEVPQFTSSIDAALSLVPEGLVWDISSGTKAGLPDPPWAALWSDDLDVAADGKTPALALCIAALRARAGKEGE
jgi:hypothetical protein